MDQHLIAPEPLDTLDHSAPPTDRREAIAWHIDALEDLADASSRCDGWTPFSRRLFLQALAETGRISVACDYTRLSRQSAYSLRARDPIFAAGWDAACELARMPLADALYEAALDGVTDTITHDDGRTVTRHRFDSRLSIAVLNRLDRRCDLAAGSGASHAPAVRRWDEFIVAIGRGDNEAAGDILDPAAAKLRQARQLREEKARESEESGITDHVWFDEDLREWRTDYPPRDGFTADCKQPEDEDGDYYDDYDDDDDDSENGGYYSRPLDPEELELVERRAAAEKALDRADDEADRDAWLARLRTIVADLAASGEPSGEEAAPAGDAADVKSSPGP